ncbi:hypothetical protein [Colwellia psychrerythraea]|uniref:Lipoprotein n=1 Tax=Colwellia psychrerythraea TaxID=28229 RepID=A0A099KYQ5_COLPS|nr:hypothetical protein [Colwellia psychrerythraea]KGJ94977.1 hypothetical protein GAB14E_2211 [Colwellia psychrerythraea]
MRFGYFLICVLLLSACGEGGSSDNKISPEHSELIYLKSHSINDLIKLDDGTLWSIVGLSLGDGTLSAGEADVIIYDNPNDFGEPNQGVKGQYYVFINNTAASFYIDPIQTPTILQQGNIALAPLSVGSVMLLDDDSIWRVDGIDYSDVNTGGIFDYTLYDVGRNFPDLTSQTTEKLGEFSDWYLYNEYAPFGYYLEPLTKATIIWQGLHTFYSEGENDSILLSDGSLWLITGAFAPATTASGEYSITLIQNVNLLDEPILGDTAETVMYIQGHETAFYLKKI